ncbi:ABC transporter permease [Halorussus caseinilyticus]|uniref:ABC transporter permease n=1 Tax=Halorussus caseinilyticus TaxID=3034025 RepID=A0ABD5WQ35_9EURY
MGAKEFRSRTETPTSGTGLWNRQVGAFVRRYLREVVRDRTVLFWSLGFPTVFYLLTITTFIQMSQIPDELHAAVKATTALSYGVFGSVVVCLNAFGQQLVTDIEDERYTEFRSLPLSPSADFVGRLVAGLLFAFVAFLFVVAVSVATGAGYVLRGPESILVVALAFVLMAVVWMVIALLIVLTVGNARYANIISLSVALASYFGTGFNGTDVTSFAGSDWLLNALPNTLATRLMTYHLADIQEWEPAGLAPPDPPSSLAYLGLLAVYGVVFLGIGTVLTKKILYKE